MRFPQLLVVVTLLLAGAAHAEPVYRCVRTDGSVYLGQERPAPGSCVEQSTTQWDPPAPTPTPVAAPPLPAPPAPAVLPAAPEPVAPRGRADILANPPGAEPSGRYGLWEQREGAGPWRDIGGFGAQGPCQVERDRRVETTRSRLVGAIVDEPGAVKLKSQGNREYVRYWCLPEGIRPA